MNYPHPDFACRLCGYTKFYTKPHINSKLVYCLRCDEEKTAPPELHRIIEKDTENFLSIGKR